MSTPFIPEDQIASAKLRYAEALRAYKLHSPFDREAPFKAALTIWPEEDGKLPIALWAVHGQRWFEDEEVVAYIEEMNEEAAEEARQAKLQAAAEIMSPEMKLLIKSEMIAQLRKDMVNAAHDLKERTAAMDRLSKLLNLDEKAVVDPDEGRVLGVIHHRLAPMTDDEYAAFARKQQDGLQAEVNAKMIELDAADVRIVN